MSRETATWREMIGWEMEAQNDDWSNVVSNTMSESEMDVVFDASYGSANGIAFTVWTKTRVYFPCQYDGSEWCDSVPRDPDGCATSHVGG